MKKAPHFSFMLAGWGLGHATRTHAIILELKARYPNMTFAIFTWGNALQYFAHFEFTNIVPLIPYLAEAERLNDTGPLKKKLRILRWAMVWIRNVLLIRRKMAGKRNQAHIVISDSDFHQPATWLLCSARYAICQTPFIIENWARFSPSNQIWRWRVRLFLWERIELFWQTTMSKILICPRLDFQRASVGKIRFVRPIVRREFQNERKQFGLNGKILVLTSGSAAATEINELISGAHVDCERPSEGSFGITEFGSPLIDKFAAVISQCGYSTLSELQSRKVPALLLPVAGSPEQHVNAKYMAAMSSDYQILDTEKDVGEQISAWRANVRAGSARDLDGTSHVFKADGARETVAIIAESDELRDLV